MLSNAALTSTNVAYSLPRGLLRAFEITACRTKELSVVENPARKPAWAGEMILCQSHKLLHKSLVNILFKTHNNVIGR